MTRCLGLVPAVSLYVAQKLKAGSVSAIAAVSKRTTTGLACTREPLFLPLGGSAEPTRKAAAQWQVGGPGRRRSSCRRRWTHCPGPASMPGMPARLAPRLVQARPPPARSTRTAAVSNTKSHVAWPVSSARRHLPGVAGTLVLCFSYRPKLAAQGQRMLCGQGLLRKGSPCLVFACVNGKPDPALAAWCGYSQAQRPLWGTQGHRT